jgi:hypothetical protein
MEKPLVVQSRNIPKEKRETPEKPNSLPSEDYGDNSPDPFNDPFNNRFNDPPPPPPPPPAGFV